MLFRSPARSPGNPRERLLEVRARGSGDVLAGRVTCSRTRPGWGGTRTGPAPTLSRLSDGCGPRVRAGRRQARRRGPPGRARVEPGLRNSRSPQQNPPRLTRCDLSSTRSASARSVQAHLAQCVSILIASIGFHLNGTMELLTAVIMMIMRLGCMGKQSKKQYYTLTKRRFL